MLMIMDASFNVAMEPFRALVGDNLRADQHTLGFSVQTALIGIGAVIGSWLPYVLNNWFGVSNLATETSAIPQNLIYSFIICALILVGSILVTIFTTKEYSPEELTQFSDEKSHQAAMNESEKESKLTDIFTDFAKMPETMRQLSWVQFFSWFGLFGMWVFTTPAIAQHIYGLSIDDTKSSEFQSAGDWVGIIFGVYNLVSAIVAFALPYIAKQVGRRKTHALSLILGGIGLISMYFMPNKEALILSMILVMVRYFVEQVVDL
jgi:maltose/moltooligosaccharide transporter